MCQPSIESTCHGRPARAGRWAAGVIAVGFLLPNGCMAQQQAASANPAANGLRPLAAMSGTPAAALRVGLGERTHVVYEPRPWVPGADFHAAPEPGQQAALALEFKSAPKDQGARGLLKVRLSGDSVLHFRPRGGGLTVTYKSQF